MNNVIDEIYHEAPRESEMMTQKGGNFSYLSAGWRGINSK